MELRGTHGFPGRYTSRDAVLRYQRQSLAELLQYVWRSSTFYREYYAGHGIGEADLGELTFEDLPILTKKTLMDHFDRLTGYSSSTAMLAELALRGELMIRPKSIWVTADL